MRLILVRHPKPACEPGLCYGRLDLECEQDALDTAVLRLAGLAEGCHIVTSPARRTRDLAGRLGAAGIEPRLQELDFGDWEGRLWLDLGSEAVEEWRQALPDAAPPGGETLSAMAARCAAWLGSLDPAGATVLAVTHAGPVRVIRALLNGEPVLTHFTAPVTFAEPVALEVDSAAVAALRLREERDY